MEAAALLARLAGQGAMIRGLAADSRRVAPGVAFLAYPGERADGRAHIPDALGRGAAAVLWEEAGFSWARDWDVPNVAVRGLKQHASAIAHEFHGRPSEKLWVCGVTGTNGKTTCSQWLAHMLGAAGEKTAVIGTLGSGFPGTLDPVANTTPDAVELQRLLRAFVDAGARAVAMEVSSHGLVQGRVEAIQFDCALFTNLSHDHLDYHGSMEAYAEAKARLFDRPGLEVAVLNLDDEQGLRLAQRLSARGLRTIGYGLSASAARGSVSEYIALDSLSASGMVLVSSRGSAHVPYQPVGRFNASNVLGVLGCLLAYGLEFSEAAQRLVGLPPVAGRMQQVGERPMVVIDYAHTPDALEKVLQALRPVAEARRGALVALFGAGGDRDRAKRPRMGEVAERLADRIVLTSDNPRSEDPRAIIRDIERGIGGAREVEPDRARAIAAAIGAASERDVVLIAGKGHEEYQEVAGKRLPFSDADAARAALERRSGP